MGNENVKATPHIKGGAFPETLAVVEEMLGPERYRDLVEHLPSAFREALEINNILLSAWYPMEWIRAIHAQYDRITGDGLEASEEIGYVTSMRQFNGLYRIFFRLLKPETLLGKSGSIFAQFYSMGRFELLEKRPGFALCNIYSPGFDARLWAETAGVCRAALEICGARNVTTLWEKGGSDGDDESWIIAEWQ